MERQISDLINICRELGSEKGPERRKAALKLKNCLNQSGIKKALDKNYELKQSTKNAGRVFTWDNVFKGVCLYVSMETDELKHASDSVSRTTLSNREGRKQDASALVKSVVRMADKGGPKLKGSVLFSHMVETLRDTYTCNAYGQDYCSILLKNVLSCRKYVVELNPNTWHELLSLFCKLFNNTEVKIDKLVLARIIHSLVCGITTQCDVRPKKILTFFTEFFNKAREHKSSVLLEYMLLAVNTFIQAIGPTSRVQICKLGEDIFPGILHIWHNVAADKLKDSLVEFLQYQLWCHHPRGEKQGSTAAYAVDWDRWMSHLRKLYELMYTEIQEMGSKTRSKDCTLKLGFVCLAADVCQQLFSESSHSIEVTQVSYGSGDTQQGPGAKKRRLDSGWEAIRNFIVTAGQTVKLIPWLQLVTQLVQKYTSSLPKDEIVAYLTCLSHTLADCKRTDLMSYILSCLRVFVCSWDALVTMVTDVLVQQTKHIWHQVWTVCLRFVSLHHTEAEGYRLLSALIEKGLVSPGRDIWSLFVPSVTQPVTESVRFLCLHLAMSDIPEKHVTSLVISGPDSSLSSTYPLRNQLIDWLLPGREDENEGGSKSVCKVDPDWTARALVTLTLRNPAEMRMLNLENNSEMSDLEKQYLQTSLEMPLKVEELFCENRKDLSGAKPVHIAVLWKQVEDVIKKDVQYFVDNSVEQVCELEEMCTYACMMVKVMTLLLQHQIVSIATMATCSLLEGLTKLMKKITTDISELSKKEGNNVLHGVLVSLQRVYTLEDGKEEECSVIANICRAVTPSRLVDFLMDIATEKGSLKASTSTQSDTSLNQSRFNKSRFNKSGGARLLDDFDDDFDLEFDDQSNPNNDNTMEIDDMDFTDGMDSQEVEDTNSNVEVFRCMLSPAALPEGQAVRLEAVRTLCVWCGYDLHPTRGLQIHSEVDVKYIKSKIVRLLTSGGFDPTRHVDIQILVLIVKHLTSKHQAVIDKDMDIYITTIQQVVKLHRRDQEVCTAILDMLVRLVPYLSQSDMVPSNVLQECRDKVLHLVNVIWRLQEEDNCYCSAVRKGMAMFMERLVQCDPGCEWSKFVSDIDDSGDDGPTPASRYIEYGADYCHMVRMYVTSSIYKLFLRGEDKDIQHMGRDIQEQMFDKVYGVLNDSLDIQGKLSAERLEDERVCRVASVLTGLATVICISPVCEKKAVFALLKLSRDKHVEIPVIHRILVKVSRILGYKMSETFLESHLPFLIQKWLHLSFPIAEFPWKLLVCENVEQFYRKYMSTIIPALMTVRDLVSLETIATSLQMDGKLLLADCVPKVVVHILPLFAASKLGENKNDELVKKRTNKATACYNMLINELKEEVVDRQIVNNLDEIVVNILKCLYDDEQDVGAISDTNPEPNPPMYNTYITTSTLDYITKSFSGSGKTLVEILSKTTDSIQKILLELSTSLFNSHRLAEKRRVLHMYQLFCRLLLKQFNKQLGGAWLFVLRDVIVRLVYIIKDMTLQPLTSCRDSCYRENITSLALDLLRDVCVAGVDVCPQELMKYLPLLSSNLISVVHMSGDITEQALGLLKYLILEKAGVLRSGISSLDNFPDLPVFKECKALHNKLKYAKGPFTLKQEVEHFLATSEHENVDPVFRLEGLEFLYDQLTTHSDTLSKLSQEDSMLRLVCELVDLTKCDSVAVQLEAGRCLGVLGPVNLTTLSIPTHTTSPQLQLALQCFEDAPDVQKYCKIFHCLNHYLTDRSITLVDCAGCVLKNMLSVKTGIGFTTGYKAQIGDNDYLLQYLHPFMSRAGKKKPVQIPGPAKHWETFQTTVDQECVWNPHHSNHDNWIITLTTTLISSGAVTDEILRLLGPVCSMKSEFCELILPYLIHNILSSGDLDYKEVISRQIDNYFSCHCGQTSGRISRCTSLTTVNIPTVDVLPGDEYVCMNVDSVKTMLDVVQYIRQQTRPAVGRNEMTVWDNNFWLDIDYLQVAMAAQYCSAHFSAIMYAEIWCDVQRDKTEGERSQGRKSQGSSQSLSQDTRIDTLSVASSSQSGVTVQDLLLEAYRWIGEPDGVYGCGAGRKADTSSRICTYQHENQWDKAVISCDIQMSQSGPSTQYDLLHALQNFGAGHILDTYLQGMMGNGEVPNLSSDTRELQFEAAWRMGKWNIDLPNKLQSGIGFHECLYKAIKSVKEDHYTFTESALTSARLCAMSRLKDGCLDSAQRLYPVLADLQCVSIMDTVAQALQTKAGLTSLSLPKVVTEEETDFEFTLPSLYMTCTALRLVWEKSGHKQVLTDYTHSLYNLARSARVAGRHQICERAVHSYKLLGITDLSLGLPGQIEEARLYWARGEHNIAKHLVRIMIDKLRKLKSVDRSAAQYYPQVLSIYGNWLAETRSENPNVIMENYLEKTVKLFEQLGEYADKSMDAYLSLGRYADSQYQNINNYMKSSTFEAKQSLMKKAQLEAERLREVMGESAKDRYLRTLEKQSEIDEAELECMVEDRDKFLLKAVENYVKCLRSGDTHNLRVFRLTSLWFNNANNEQVNQLIQDGIGDIKTYKWLPLMYQLAARMEIKPHRDTSQQFLNTLNKLIHDTAVCHPHHTLFCVLALANANRDTELQQGKTTKKNARLSKSQADTPQEEGRVQAAKEMIGRLREDRHVGAIVKDLQALSDAYIQLANWNVNQYKTETKPIQLPAALWISKVKELKNVPIPTRDIKVEPSGCYDNIAYIQKFQPTFKLAGGINLPKIIGCLGSDGKNSRQLVKGRDDLRQDAVMQQVFDMVNNLLQKNVETRKRQLQIRKYKVIPLSQRSGLLEWCEGTQPIGEYLIGNTAAGVKGAHTRYRPQDWPSYDCRKHLAAASSAEGKYKAYLEICVKFAPVFRHFFMEKFSLPALWFEKRLAYTRSVATNSIVGYILGLGDRHVQNILIDCNSAELVHIDLGVAFEQGEILPTPETVPFRLTRDIEDAMGASGVEGVFRRCCEKTMEVMRSNQEALLTILEVLLYDPLHAWTISPAKAYALQQRRNDSDTMDLGITSTGDIMDLTEGSSNRNNSETQENVNKLAERVLLRLQQKLQGLEDGVQLSLQGQVNHLIQEARNPKNLARLFAGWQPFI